MEKGDYLPKKLSAIDWQQAICPFCGRVYQYLPDHKPKTCGKFDCLYAIAQKKLKEKEGS